MSLLFVSFITNNMIRAYQLFIEGTIWLCEQEKVDNGAHVRKLNIYFIQPIFKFNRICVITEISMRLNICH